MTIKVLVPSILIAAAALAEDDLLRMEQELLFPGMAEEVLPRETDYPVLIMGTGEMSGEALAAFLMEQNPDADEQNVTRLAGLYIEESTAEGVNSDIAFIQMCLETGFLTFQGLVSENMNNFCGLGAVGPGQRGLAFPDERTGVRAHIQHLKAYGSTEPPVSELVDPRYQYVNPKGKSPDIFGLAGTWAADPQYGTKLADLLEKLFL